MIVAGVVWALSVDTGDEPVLPKLRQPRYQQEHWRTRPLLFLDEAHDNTYTIGRRFQALAELARQDGYRVAPNRRQFQTGALKGVNVLVVAGARMSEQEIEAARDWVTRGGGLLLIGSPGVAGRLGPTRQIGKGRLAVFDDVDTFLPGSWKPPTVLNVMHWLTGR